MVIGLVPGLPRKVVKRRPFALPLCPLKGDYLDAGVSMMTGVKIRSPLLGSPPDALFYEKITLILCSNKRIIEDSVELKFIKILSERNVCSFSGT